MLSRIPGILTCKTVQEAELNLSLNRKAPDRVVRSSVFIKAKLVITEVTDSGSGVFHYGSDRGLDSLYDIFLGKGRSVRAVHSLFMQIRNMHESALHPGEFLIYVIKHSVHEVIADECACGI